MNWYYSLQRVVARVEGVVHDVMGSFGEIVGSRREYLRREAVGWDETREVCSQVKTEV